MSGPSIIARTIDAAHVPAVGLDVAVETNERQRAALAEAYDLVAVKALAATATLTPGDRRAVLVEGRVTADIVQSCVVTLAPVEQHIDESFSVRFVPAESPEAPKPKAGAEVVIDPAAPDPPEIMEGNTVALGALVEELFALAIEPYPRAPDAALPAAIAGSRDTGGESPFAVLAKVRPGKG
jgi:uncharacterized metal-binding protein YceD (DUF177 family)